MLGDIIKRFLGNTVKSVFTSADMAASPGSPPSPGSWHVR
jgi:hypothetical protein